MNAVDRLTPDVLGTRFVKDLDILDTANSLRRREVPPGMLSYLERALLMNLVRTTWRGEGAVVDAGSFFGASIVAAAEGMRSQDVAGPAAERFPDGKPIHGFELGHMPHANGPKVQVRTWYGVDYRAGDSFVPRLEKTVAPYSDLVQLHIGDLTKESWSPDAPIEIAFIDVCKTKFLNAHVTKEFHPALLPDGATLINREFFGDGAPWLKVTMGHLKDYYRWEGQVQTSSIYRSIAAVPADVAAYDPFQEASYEECLALHDAVEFPGLHRRYEFRLRLSRATLARLKGHSDDSMDILKEIEADYADVLGHEKYGQSERSRYERIHRQVSSNTFAVRTGTVERMNPDVIGSPFVKDLDVVDTADALRKTDVVPGMLSYVERGLIQNLVARKWRGDGVIIDGGSFFGSSIVALAEGVRANGLHDPEQYERFPGGKPIHGYELGYFPRPAGEKEYVRSFFGVEYRAGDSFVPILEKAVEPYQDLIQLHIGDLNEEEWPQDAPIEVAFIDVCKSIDLNAHVSKVFYPALIPGGSTLVNQDFFFDRLPWVKVTMAYLKDYFTWEGQVMSSSIYRTVKQVPADVAAFDPFKEASYEECLALHDAVEFPGLHRRFEFRMALSRAYLMTLKGHKDDALDTLHELGSTYADLLGDVHMERGEQFRYDRAVKQISNDNIFKVV
jgi:hypothetical protein